MPSVQGSRWLPASPEKVWPVVSDLDGYGRFVPGLSTRVLGGEGACAVRQCSDARGHWVEDVVEWVEGERYTMRVRTDADDYPFPLRAMTGTWSLAAEGDGTRVHVRFTVRPRGLRGWLWLLRQRGGNPVKALLDAYERGILDGG